MIKRLLFLFFILTPFAYSADINEIWITPENSDYTRLSTGLAGSNITIISSKELKNFSDKDISEILKFYSGIQVRNLYSDISSSNATIDMRGFGEASSSNFLMLMNGKRLNDLDMGAINFSNIPIKSIDRIEIIRGNSAATLYGSGAVGGSINIITKDSSEVVSEVDLKFGSHNSSKLDLTSSTNLNETTSVMISGRIHNTDTYREGGDYDRRDFLLRINNKNESLHSYFDINNNSKNQLLPGTRIIGGVFNYHLCNLLANSRTARNIGGSFETNANNCNIEQRDDYANEENTSFSGGFEALLPNLQRINFDATSKRKKQKAFLGADGNTASTPSNGDRYIDTDLKNIQLSLTLDDTFTIDNNLAIVKYGFDFGDTEYKSKRQRKEDEAVGQYYEASQETRAFFVQTSANIPSTAGVLSFGIRNEKTIFSARDTVDRNIDGFRFNFQATDHASLASSSSNTIFNIGFEKILSKNLKVFTKYAESFRTPNIDERILSTNNGSFSLLDQESDEIEFGLRFKDLKSNLSISFYSMDTRNEIQFDQRRNTNLDDITREGINLDLSYQIDNDTRLNSSYSYVNAEFTSGTLSPGNGGPNNCDFSNTTYCSNSNTWQTIMGGGISYSLIGKSVPLVSPHTINLSLDRKINSNNTIIFELNYVDEKHVSNDQENIEPKIPDYYLVNIKLRNSSGPASFLLGINNLLNKKYYDFAVSSTIHRDDHFGLQGLYPLAERTAYINFNYEF